MELVRFTVADAVEGFGVDGLGELLHLVDQRACLVGNDQPAGTLVAIVDAALDPALLFQPVDQPAERRLFDLEHLGERRLAHPFAAIDVDQHAPLRARQAERLDATVVDPSQQA